MDIKLPVESPDFIYEGLDPTFFEAATGEVLNRAPRQLTTNIDALRHRLTEIVLDTPIYSGATTYSIGRMARSDSSSKIIYISQTDNNVGNLLSDLANWKPVTFNIDDLITSLVTTWSSTKTVAVINATAEEEGIVNSIVFGG